MPIAVRVTRGVPLVTLSGDIHYDEMEQLRQKLAVHVVGGYVDKLIVDESQMGFADLESRKAAILVARQYHFRKVAMVKSTPLNNALTRFIARQSRHVEQIEFFDTVAEALEWLRKR